MQIKIEPYFRVTVYSHFFTIDNVKQSTITGLILRFSLKYTHEQPGQAKNVSNAAEPKIYAIRTADGMEFRFHRGQLKPFLDFIYGNHVIPEFFVVEYKELYVPKQLKLKAHSKWKLREQQLDAREFILQETEGDFNSRMVTMPTGSGKEQPLDALVKTPGGWIQMGQIEIGQQVTAADGTTSTVIGVYPQGKKHVIKITFGDYRQVECGLDHLWKVYNEDWQGNKWRVITTSEIIELRKTTQSKLFIPLATSEKIQDIQLENDPYVLGLWIVLHNAIAGKSVDMDILTPYLNGSNSQRQSLLQGIFDQFNRLDISDPTKKTFMTNDKTLAYAVQLLAHSLGAVCSIVENRGFNRFKYRLFFTTKSEVSGKLLISYIDEVGVKECQCIEIDHPEHLYVTNSYVVTHNTVTSMLSAIDRQFRIGIIIPAKYSEKWLSDVAGIADVNPKKEIMEITGSAALRGILLHAKGGNPMPSYIVFSLTTLQNFFKLYLDKRHSDEFKSYECEPHEIFEILGIGTVIIDEAHEQTYSIFRLLCFTHVPKVVGLSGTYLSGDPFIDNIQKTMFPLEIRFNEIKMKKYIKAYAIAYNFKDMRAAKIRCTEFASSSYSQTVLEKTIIKHQPTFENYLKLLIALINIGYLNKYQKGDKLAIYAGSIAMCTLLTDRLKKIFPHLDVRRYVEEDPYENVIEADIRVTTTISAGTAIDIPQLTCVILTNSIRSEISNLQTLGRLRELPGRDTNFIYIYSTDIPKQVKYHYEKMKLIEDRVAFVKEFNSPIIV